MKNQHFSVRHVIAFLFVLSLGIFSTISESTIHLIDLFKVDFMAISDSNNMKEKPFSRVASFEDLRTIKRIDRNLIMRGSKKYKLKDPDSDVLSGNEIGLSKSYLLKAVNKKNEEFPEFQKAKVTLHYNAAQLRFKRKRFYHDKSKRTLVRSSSLKKAQLIIDIEGIKPNDVFLDWIADNCPINKLVNELILCREELSFMALKGGGDNGNLIYLPLVDQKKKCDELTKESITTLGLYKPFDIENYHKDDLKDHQSVTLLLPDSLLSINHVSENVVQMFNVNLGRAILFELTREEKKMCAFQFSIESLKGDDGVHCSTDEECLSGCCKNDTCASLRVLEGQSCSKQIGEGCLAHSYCSLDSHAVVFKTYFNNSLNRCDFYGKSGRSHLLCHNSICTPFYKYREVPILERTVSEEKCVEGIAPDFLHIYKGAQANSKEPVKVRYIP